MATFVGGVIEKHTKRSDQVQITKKQDWLAGGGEMGKLIRSMDWSKTPLGPIERWPQSLRTTASLCLASNFPISLAWGPKHTQIYNDGYWPICGGKHPLSMGQDFSECWASAWPAIGEAFNRALAGETSYLENQRMFLDRNGYLEETFFTFSFSPIRDETGGVGGLFHPVTETTSKMLAERRTRALRDLAARTGKANTSDEALTVATQVLASYDLDLPFVLLYAIDAKRHEGRLVSSTGLDPGSPASPLVIDLVAEEPVWPLAEVMQSLLACEIDLWEKRDFFSCGPYPEPPKLAVALPVTAPGQQFAAAIFIAGVSSRLPLTDMYRGFHEQLAATISTAVANARAYEEEKLRAEKLSALDRAKTVFFSNVSHELRTPLTLMLGPLEETLERAKGEIAAEDYENITVAYRNCLRLLKLVNTLLDFSRIEAGRIQAVYRPTDLATLTINLVSVFRSAIEKAGLQLIVDCPPLPKPVYVDRDMWEKIVLNLLSNAIKYTLQGSITVRQHAAGEHVELSVEDTGCGIPESELGNVFKRFYRIERAEGRTYEGSGIGLALIKELIKFHRGNISVKSVLNQGSTFTVSLPFGMRHFQAGRIGTDKALSSTSITTQAYVEEALRWLPDNEGDAEPAAEPVMDARPRIILADDNADMREYLRKLLNVSYEVVAVPDGEAAWTAIVESVPDLLLTDVMMPKLDGFGLLARVRQDPRTRSLSVVMLSARAGEESRVEGLEAGADDYLIKPFSARELMARVRANLELARIREESIRMERLKAEELARQREHLEELNARLEAEASERIRAQNAVDAVNADLQRSNRELELFASVTSHDLQEPLHTITSYTELLAHKYHGKLDQKADLYIGYIVAGTSHMHLLINDLLAYSRVGTRAKPFEPIKMDTPLDQALNNLRKSITENKAIVEREGLPEVDGDESQLAQLFQNLIGNAIKFGKKEVPPHIRISAQRTGNEWVIGVHDNGIGIESRFFERIFGIFQRLHTREEYEGSGIGLAICRKIVEHHGGRVWVESLPGEGTSFYFTVPVKGENHGA